MLGATNFSTSTYIAKVRRPACPLHSHSQSLLPSFAGNLLGAMLIGGPFTLWYLGDVVSGTKTDVEAQSPAVSISSKHSILWGSDGKPAAAPTLAK